MTINENQPEDEENGKFKSKFLTQGFVITGIVSVFLILWGIYMILTGENLHGFSEATRGMDGLRTHPVRFNGPGLIGLGVVILVFLYAFNKKDYTGN